MKKILLETSFSKIYIIVMILISILVVGGYFSYAMFTVTKEKSNAISIVTGNLAYKLDVDGKESKTLTVEANTTKDFIITLSNPNNRVARFNFYYVGNLDEDIEAGYLATDEFLVPPIEEGVNLEKNGSLGSSNIYKIRVTNNSNNKKTITLGVSVGLDYNDLTLPDNGHLFEPYFKLDLNEVLLGDSHVRENDLGKVYKNVNLKDVKLTAIYSNDINDVNLECSGIDNLKNKYDNVELINDGEDKYTVKSNVDSLIVADISCTLTGTDKNFKHLSDTVNFKIGNGWYIDGLSGPDIFEDYYYYKAGKLLTGWQQIYYYRDDLPSGGQYNWYYFYDGTETSTDNGCYGDKNKMAYGWCKNIGGSTGWYYLYTDPSYVSGVSPLSQPYGSMLSNVTVQIKNYNGSYSSYTFNSSGRCTSGNGCF